MSSVSVIGLDALSATLKELERSAGKHSKSAYIAGGKLVEGEAKRSIQERSPGKTVTRYRSGGGSYDHNASGPNEAPNTDTGRLVSSINTEATDNGVFVGTTLDYGKYLEFGTKDMDERPWLMPALNKMSDTIVELQINAVNKTIMESATNV